MTGGGSDANFTSAMGVPTLDGLGADGDGAHTLHEYILVSTLEQRLKFWELLLKELEKAPEALRASPWALPSSGHAGGPAKPDPRHQAWARSDRCVGHDHFAPSISYFCRIDSAINGALRLRIPHQYGRLPCVKLYARQEVRS